MSKKKICQPAQMCFLKNGPLISVVVPVYNMEKYLSRCLDSILRQTYENLEIIVVDDCSTDQSAKLIEQYIEQDERIKRITHEKNRGLFQARISGADIATGKYLAFVDSDDHLSIDWFRTLLKKAEAVKADVVVGEWCYDYGEKKAYCNLDPFRVKDFCLEGNDVLAAFMEQEGRSFSWSVVWNKLYAKTLWNQCVSEFRKFSREHGHMIMWEDIAFSSGLWAHAQKVVNVHHANYYYFQHAGASTAPQKSRKRNLKYITDSSAALLFMKQQLMEVGRHKELEEHYLHWKQRFVSIVYHDIVTDLGLRRLEKPIREAFAFYDEFTDRDSFFYELTTLLHPAFSWLEDIKQMICAPQTAYVSFDIFDTLVCRPFMYPTDLFAILSDELNKDGGAYINFRQIRIDAEKNCRKQVHIQFPSREEITLDEIYETIKQDYAIAPEIVDRLKEYEVRLELEFIRTRETGKGLYELAVDAGKQIIICSDMYLSKQVVESILQKNGYTGYKKLYLSSELQQVKSTKNLYNFVKKDLHCKSKNAIIHIGDNWTSDIENARACGMGAGHLAKASDMIENLNPGIYSGDAYSKIFSRSRNDWMEDYWSISNDYTGLRCVLALVANHIFDNPYVSFHSQSDFNANPTYIGYFSLGSHLLALALWIAKFAKQHNIPTIHFVARDGYMVKRAFDIINQTPTSSGYIRLSRRALLLADVERKEDLYSLNNKIYALGCSPQNLQKYLLPIIPKTRVDRIQQIVEANNFFFDRKFKTVPEYERCLKLFIEQIVDFSLLPAYKEQLRAYFSEIIKPGDYIFDVGYSGRPESALSNILGYPVGSFYIHVNSEMAEIRQQKYQCPSECFYPCKPCVTGVIREHLLMELGPSTIGYEEVNGKLQPQFEEYEPSYESDFVTEIIQSSALELVRDYYNTFQDRLILPLNALSAPFEYYLHHSQPFDRQIFSTLKFEDKLGEGRSLSALAFWNNAISVHGLLGDGKNVCIGLPEDLNDLYWDGVFVKFYRKINRWFPKGGRGREIMKKIAPLFIR